MSKPALGRGLASLLQEETGRGAVKAPGLNPLKGSADEERAVLPNGSIPATSPAEVVTVPSMPVEGTASAQAPAIPVAGALAEVPGTGMPQVMAGVRPVPVETQGGIPAVPRPEARVTQAPIGPVAVGQPSAATDSGTANSGAPSVTTSTEPTPSSAVIPGWIVPALVVGDLVAVVSGILWASSGRGWGRWPWIAALFAIGCSQALAALFLKRSSGGTRRAFSTGPTSGHGAVPGVRVRFVEEQIPGRRGDRR